MENTLSNLGNSVSAYVPNIVAGLVILVVAWLLATLASMIVRRLARASKIDERLNERKIPDALGQGTFWLIMLVSLPAVLSALGVQSALQPIQGMLSRLLGFLPNLFGATLIFVIGWFVARLVRNIVTSLLKTTGIDAFGERLGLRESEHYQLSGFVGMIAYLLILLPVSVATLNALSLDAVTGPLSAMLNTFLAAIPQIFAAALIIGLSIVIGRVVSGLVASVLAGVGFDSVPLKLGFGNLASAEEGFASKTIGRLAFVTILFLGGMEASRVLGFVALTTLMSNLIVFGGHLLMGAVIFCVGLFLANLAASSIMASDVENPKLLAGIARFAILFVVGAMALGQMGLAKDIVNLGFGLLLGAFAVAGALAFGLGGRETAGRIVAQMFSEVRAPSLVKPVEPTKRDVA
ncbi:MAG: hypothetical protein CXZ00_05925 [Acidobacteria bacterium]|nr:MAG: hypothetical protein CXZ00_05925 [Acidobacteriota bacterium]